MIQIILMTELGSHNSSHSQSGRNLKAQEPCRHGSVLISYLCNYSCIIVVLCWKDSFSRYSCMQTCGSMSMTIQHDCLSPSDQRHCYSVDKEQKRICPSYLLNCSRNSFHKSSEPSRLRCDTWSCCAFDQVDTYYVCRFCKSPCNKTSIA